MYDCIHTNWINREYVLKAIDEVMHNREISSIRNGILAIRDKVLQAQIRAMPFTNKYYIQLGLYENEHYACLPEFGSDGSKRDGATSVIFDMTDWHPDTKTRGSIYYKGGTL